jgi:carboxypeptidase C (cathepsin A)
MIGLFQELGPCRINNQSTGVNLNPTSWNNYANVYVSIIPNFIYDN